MSICFLKLYPCFKTRLGGSPTAAAEHPLHPSLQNLGDLNARGDVGQLQTFSEGVNSEGSKHHARASFNHYTTACAIFFKASVNAFYQGLKMMGFHAMPMYIQV